MSTSPSHPFPRPPDSPSSFNQGLGTWLLMPFAIQTSSKLTLLQFLNVPFGVWGLASEHGIPGGLGPALSTAKLLLASGHGLG